MRAVGPELVDPPAEAAVSVRAVGAGQGREVALAREAARAPGPVSGSELVQEAQPTGVLPERALRVAHRSAACPVLDSLASCRSRQSRSRQSRSDHQ
jgi:hypothetical protein